MGQLDVELGDAALGVRRQRQVDGAPPDVDVRVVVHLLGVDRECGDCRDRLGEAGELDAAVQTLPVGRPARQRRELTGHLGGVEEPGHGRWTSLAKCRSRGLSGQKRRALSTASTVAVARSCAS